MLPPLMLLVDGALTKPPPLERIEYVDARSAHCKSFIFESEG